MSQGELLALSVSVFLPRAALDESPFRFAVIDDPVQAMDPAKVDGLARVLHRAARDAPDRRLHPRRPPARGDPAAAAGRDDAARRPPRALDRRRPGLAQPGPALPRRRARLREAATGSRPRSRRASCRCSAAARSRPPRPTSSAAARSSTAPSLDEADEQIDEARTLRETLALVLFGEAGRQGEVGDEIRAATATPPPRSSPSSTAARTATCSTPRRSSACPRARASFIHELMAMSERLTVAAVLDEAAAPARRVRPRDLRRLAARRRGADPPVAGVHAQRLLAHARPACWTTSWRDRWVCLPAYLGDRPEARAADFAWTRALAGLPPPRLRGRPDAGRAARHLATARAFLDDGREAVV